jgi:transposase-like protein
MSGTKGMKHYTAEFKLAAVQRFLKGGVTRRQIAEEMGISSGDLVKTWVHKFRTEKDPFGYKPHGRKKKVPGQPETLEEEVKRLRMENDLLKKLQSESLEIMLATYDIGQSKDSKRNTQ